MYNTRNKAIAAFIIKRFGREAFQKAELFNNQIFMYFDIDRNDSELLDFIRSFNQVTDIVNEIKTYDEYTPR